MCCMTPKVMRTLFVVWKKHWKKPVSYTHLKMNTYLKYTNFNFSFVKGDHERWAYTVLFSFPRHTLHYFDEGSQQLGITLSEANYFVSTPSIEKNMYDPADDSIDTVSYTHLDVYKRQNFNDAAQAYNTNIRRFPKNIFAGMFGFDKKAYFEAEERCV